MPRKTRLNLRTTPRHERGKMNVTERRFAELLQGCLMTGTAIQGIELPLPVVPLRWEFEAIDLTLAGLKTQYRPDFYVLTVHGQGVFFEIKARTHAGKVLWEDAGRVKFKVAAEKYFEFRFICASWNSKTGWKFEEINP